VVYLNQDVDAVLAAERGDLHSVDQGMTEN